MTNAPVDPRWPKVLSLTVHEFRTPITVVSGYIRMLLQDRAGELSEPQRRLLEAAEKSCGRLSALVAEVSELSSLEGGTLASNKAQTDLHAALTAAVGQIAPLAEREIPIELQLADGPTLVHGDPIRLAQAFAAIFGALRREIVTADRLLVREARLADGRCELSIGDEETLAALAAADDLPVFDEWRGGVGLSLLVARRILEAHGGQVWGAPGGQKAGARIRIG